MQAKNMQMFHRNPFGISLRNRDVTLNNDNAPKGSLWDKSKEQRCKSK